MLEIRAPAAQLSMKDGRGFEAGNGGGRQKKRFFSGGVTVPPADPGDYLSFLVQAPVVVMPRGARLTIQLDKFPLA